MKKSIAILLCILSVALTSCAKLKSSDSDSQSIQSLSLNPYENAQHFFGTVNTLTVQVAYEVGAEPYVVGAGGRSLWNLLDANIRALFQGRSYVPTIEVPKQISAMRTIESQNKALWTNNDIYELSQRLRQNNSTSDHGYIWVVFLNGNFSTDGEKANTSTLAVNISQSGVIAVFKSVIRTTVNTAGGDLYSEMNAEYLEQATVIHEIGHALGLVELGIPSTTDHHDGEHPGHCKNPNCVMYYLNNGASNIREWIAKVVITGDSIIFDEACLKDAHDFQPSK